MSKKKQKMEGPSHETMRANSRRVKKQLDELKLYQWIQDKTFDLCRKDDPSYVGAKARELDWSRGRLESAIQRIWTEAKRDLATAANRAKRDEIAREEYKLREDSISYLVEDYGGQDV